MSEYSASLLEPWIQCVVEYMSGPLQWAQLTSYNRWEVRLSCEVFRQFVQRTVFLQMKTVTCVPNGSHRQRQSTITILYMYLYVYTYKLDSPYMCIRIHMYDLLLLWWDQDSRMIEPPKIQRYWKNKLEY